MNDYIWKLYLDAGGREVATFFEDNFYNAITTETADIISNMQAQYCASKEIVNATYEQLEYVLKWYNDPDEEYDPEIMSLYRNKKRSVKDNPEKVIEKRLANLWDKYYGKCFGSDQEGFEYFSSVIALETSLIAINNPEFFVPYFFKCNFNVLENIASVFGITIPQVPLKKNYRERYMYYGELCKSWYEFRQSNGWTVYELCAFLYDFAPKYIGGIDSYIVKDLPAPRSAYFIGGHGTGGDASAEDDPHTVTHWQCNTSTRAGDMIVMYLRTPVSAISSVWRSCSVGFIDPFFFFYYCTYIGSPVKVKRVGLDKIKKDSLLKEMPIVRKNMQGINGVELKPSEYNRILNITSCKAQKLAYEEIVGSRCVNEKDVEETIIKPFLKKIGYSTEDYIQQLYVAIGNHNNTLIPDFVLLPKRERGNWFGYTIVEAKRSITKKKELQDALVQVRSYALLLRAKYAAVASEEGIWITSNEDGYEEIIVEQTWAEMDNDKMHEIHKMLGKENGIKSIR